MKTDERDTKNSRYIVTCDTEDFKCIAAGKRITAVYKKLIILFASIAIVLGCSTVGNKPEGSGTTFAKDALAPFIESGQLPGAINVFYKDGLEEITCVGYADVAAKRPITMNDVYMQCSQTKGFCGVTIAMLIEEGKIALDDSVAKYLPEFKELWVLESTTDSVKTLVKAKNALTIRMVMNHTGGFPFEISAKQGNIKGGGWSGGAPLRQTAAIAAASPLLFEPGTKELYSNTGIDIGAAIVEVVTDMRWEDFLKERVFDPLGMTSSSFWPTDKQLETQVEMYDCVEDAPAKYRLQSDWQQRPYNDAHVFPSAGGGLWTTANDQLKFYKMLMNLGLGENGVRILKEETVKELLAKSTRPKGMGGYSLGLTAPEEDTEDSWFGHGGAWGTNCMVNWHRKELKLWAVQLCEGPRPWDSARSEAEKKFFEYAIDNARADAFTGRVN
jgi:methyl acetate hydrolase